MKRVKEHHRSALLLFPLLLLCISGLVHAQETDQGWLHFAPKLTVKVSTDPMLRSMMLERTIDENPSSKFSEEISYVRTFVGRTNRLLPMVFFDQGSNVIPERYQTFNAPADADNYVDSVVVDMMILKEGISNDIPKYYELLNVIGYRMAYTDSVVIALEGGYSTEPGETPELAAERAQVIQEYLINIWHIQPERIRLLPPRQMCDSSANIFKQEEARRVIIYSSNISLLRPVNYRSSIVPPGMFGMIIFSIVIDPQMEAQDLAGMKLVIASGDEVLSTTDIPTSPDSTIYHMIGLWKIPRDLNDIEESLSAQLFVSTFDGKIRASNQVIIPIVIIESTYGQDNAYGDSEYDDEEESYPLDTDGSSTSFNHPRELFNIEIPFFELFDTTLSSFQEMAFTEDLGFIRNKLIKRPNRKWTIGLSTEGDQSERSDIENGQLITRIAAYHSRNAFYEGLRKDHSFQTPLYFMPEYSEPLDPFMFSKILYGDRAKEINNASKEWSATLNRGRNSLSETAKASMDTFLVHRAAGAIPPMLKILDTTSITIDTIITIPYGFSENSYKYSPEERFYTRKVSITISSYNTYRKYGYDFDYNEEYGGEYDETNYEEGEYQETDEIESSEAKTGGAEESNDENHDEEINEESKETP